MELDKIIVKHFKGNYYVWNSEDVISLRKTHRILGRLIGALPEIPRQNGENGLPLMLSLEEVYFLYNHDIIQIVDSIDLRDYGHPEVQAIFKENHQQEYIKIKQEVIEVKKAKLTSRLDMIAEAKLAKLEAQGAPIDIGSKSEFKERVSLELLAKIQQFPPSNEVTIFQHSSPLNLIYKPTTLKLTAPKIGSIDSLRIQVYTDFWIKGYYISDGLKFGGDFLVYDHDPLNFHAKFIVFCLLSAEQIDESLLRSYGRLGRNVRKNVVLAYFAPSLVDHKIEPPRVCYRIISWNQK